MSRLRSALAGAILLAAPGTAAPAAPAVAPFVGRYHQGSVDSAEDLLVLPDRIFCVAVMAGSLDLLIAGRWTRDGDTIRFDEVKPEQGPLVVAWIASDRAEDKDKIAFEFDGRSMGGQGDMLFGTSAGDAAPSDFRPLFAPGANGFDSLYTERRAAAGTGSFALAYRADETDGNAPYRIVQYRLPSVAPGAGLRVRAGYDREAMRAPLHVQARIGPSGLTLDERALGQPRPVSDVNAATCRNQLRAMETPPAPGQDDGGGRRLQPIGQKDVALTLPPRTPALFKTSYDDPTP